MNGWILPGQMIYTSGGWVEVPTRPRKQPTWGIWYQGKLDWGWCLDLHGKPQVFTSINEAHEELERWRSETGEWQAYQVKEIADWESKKE